MRLTYLNTRALELQTLYDSGLEGDIIKLSHYPPPTPMLVLTAPYLVNQIAREFKNYSKLFKVYIYASDRGEVSGTDIDFIKTHLTRSSPIFDQRNELAAHGIIVVSYQTYLTRHWPTRCRQWWKQDRKKDNKVMNDLWLEKEPG